MKKNMQTLAGWGNYPAVDCKTVYPSEIRNIKDTLTRSTIARGLGRSYGDQAINENETVAIFTKLNNFLAWDENDGVLTCEAGANLEEIISTFVPRGWMPMICPGTKFVTIGGAIANDIHGKAHHVDGSFINCVLSMTVLLADGRIVTASRTENEDLFFESFGGLGLLGSIVTATLQLRKIETSYFKQQSVKVNSLDEMLAALEKYEHYNYSVAWVDPLAKGKKLGSGVLTVGDAASISDLPPSLQKEPLAIHKISKLSVPVFMPNFALNNFTVRLLNKAVGFVQNSPKPFVHYEKFFFPLDMINHWNRGYGKRGFIQYQFVIPEENGRANLIKIMEMIAQSGCTPFLNVFKKMGAACGGTLSFPFKGYTLAIDFPVTTGLAAFTKKLDAVVLESGGRIYLGKDAMLDKTTFEKMYPNFTRWMDVKHKYDPQNTFNSNIARRLGLG